MIQSLRIRLGVFATCTLVLAGCGIKDADDAGSKPGSKPAAEHKDVVVLNEESRKNAGIEIITVTRTNFTVPLNVPGRISYNLNVTAKVSCPFAGRVQKMNFDLSAPVKQGDVMAVLDSPDSLKPLELKAPIDGAVTERQGSVGATLEAAKEIYTISDLRRVWCLASVSEEHSAAVRAGQIVGIHVLAYPAEHFAGTVAMAGPAVDETTRTLEVRLDVENPDGKLKPGMFATVSLPTDRMENQLLVPDSAVQTVQGQSCVFVEEPPAKYRLAMVRLGGQIDSQHVVLEGLDDGARVVVAGAFVLKSELLKASMEEP